MVKFIVNYTTRSVTVGGTFPFSQRAQQLTNVALVILKVIGRVYCHLQLDISQ
jgi:hypothetical protein